MEKWVLERYTHPTNWATREISEKDLAARMVHNERYKLIYYPVGNYLQLFDLDEDPEEINNLIGSTAHSDIIKKLKGYLIANLYKGDENWVKDGRLIGLENKEYEYSPSYGLTNQRSGHWPPPIHLTIL